jgi:hypothetical protein
MENLTGRKIGRLTVVERNGINKNGHIKWLCICDCGNTKTVFGTNLKRAHTASCGCLNKEAITKHNSYGSLTYQSWKGIIQRCTNPNSSKYADYGGRGIRVCFEWRSSFEAFLKDMGERPSKSFTIDRIDVNGPYVKENCRWATKSTQNFNKRRSRCDHVSINSMGEGPALKG